MSHKLCDGRLNVYIAFGVGVGTAVGVASDNMEVCMALGGALGILFGMWNNNQDGMRDNENA